MNEEPKSQSKETSTTTIRAVFPVTGMTCAGCAISVESILKSTTGVIDAGVNFANNTAWAEYDSLKTNPPALQKSIQSIGYDIIIDTENSAELQESFQLTNYLELKNRTIWASILAFPVFVIGMFFMDMPYGTWISMILTAPVLFWFGRNFFINAWKQARHGMVNMDTLVALSTGIAFVFSAFNTFNPEYWHSRGIHPHVYYEAAAVIIAFISFGKLLEEKAKSNTTTAIKKLMGLQPKTVRILNDDKEEEIPVSQVAPGQIIVLRPGERVSVDGTAVSGSSYLDESMISGEPIAVLKEAGEKLFAGTINQKGSIHFRAEKVGADTLLAHIVKMVQLAQGSKAPVQKLVDKIAGIFVPVVIGISILTFAVWMLIGGEQAFSHALLTSVTVLVIACPCALGLATPTAIMVGVGKGAENNILIKDAESLELGYKVNAVILDKTGTITEGRPVVTAMNWSPEISDKEQYFKVLYSLEINSEHPLADAIVKKLTEDGISGVQLESFDSITARGVKGIHNGIGFFVGNHQFLEEQNISLNTDQFEYVQKRQHEANTVIYFADQKKVLSIISVADKIKDSSTEAIRQLHDLGIEVHMLTGDNEQTASAVAKEVGIKSYRAEVLPSDKADFIKQLQSEGKVVAMVGDGINDSHALAQADVSIAMGKGSDIAMDVAKITLITSNLQSIPMALKLSKRTVQTIRQNLFWAFIYNIIGIPLAAGVLYSYNGFLLDPMIAGAAMALSSVSVVSNSLRLKALKLRSN
ncbi:MAG: heavy metal translocating P-type ATPase [Daejeonella sp.]|uniref:heavy metal translocating P-type ATPase n=1 Tax=Daejeonella sp. TaxID=2805397 RepID=UPI0027324201|nr:heavy metal translocating P-type ATPase [Daejeonella sp.]MDP3468591.1 heavy metal translocating P-type ATPase [Daejeonella sp.]